MKKAAPIGAASQTLLLSGNLRPLRQRLRDAHGIANPSIPKAREHHQPGRGFGTAPPAVIVVATQPPPLAGDCSTNSVTPVEA